MPWLVVVLIPVAIHANEQNAHCGQWCLYEAGLHLGHPSLPDEIFSFCGPEPELSMLALRDAAREMGFRAEGYAMPAGALRDVDYLPAVVHVRGNHFVLVTQTHEDRWEVYDPPYGYSERPAPGDEVELKVLSLGLETEPRFKHPGPWLWARERVMGEGAPERFYPGERRSFDFVLHNLGDEPADLWWGAASLNGATEALEHVELPPRPASIAAGATAVVHVAVIAPATKTGPFIFAVPIHSNSVAEDPLVLYVEGHVAAEYHVSRSSIALRPGEEARVRVIGSTREGDPPLEILGVEGVEGVADVEIRRADMPYFRRTDIYDVVFVGSAGVDMTRPSSSIAILTNAPVNPRIPLSLSAR